MVFMGLFVASTLLYAFHLLTQPLVFYITIILFLQPLFSELQHFVNPI